MIEEAYVSFETAKLLKEKGFDEPYQYFYKFDDNKVYRGTVFTNTQIGDKFYNAPTQQMAMRWLREEHNLHCNVVVDIAKDTTVYVYAIAKIGDEKYWKRGEYATYLTYEEAVEAGIKYCLENLI